MLIRAKSPGRARARARSCSRAAVGPGDHATLARPSAVGGGDGAGRGDRHRSVRARSRAAALLARRARRGDRVDERRDRALARAVNGGLAACPGRGPRGRHARLDRAALSLWRAVEPVQRPVSGARHARRGRARDALGGLHGRAHRALVRRPLRGAPAACRDGARASRGAPVVLGSPPGDVDRFCGRGVADRVLRRAARERAAHPGERARRCPARRRPCREARVVDDVRGGRRPRAGTPLATIAVASKELARSIRRDARRSGRGRAAHPRGSRSMPGDPEAHERRRRGGDGRGA